LGDNEKAALGLDLSAEASAQADVAKQGMADMSKKFMDMGGGLRGGRQGKEEQ
jgi:hypothetical protein